MMMRGLKRYKKVSRRDTGALKDTGIKQVLRNNRIARKQALRFLIIAMMMPLCNSLSSAEQTNNNQVESSSAAPRVPPHKNRAHAGVQRAAHPHQHKTLTLFVFELRRLYECVCCCCFALAVYVMYN
jgi:hypothetical protein